MPEAYPLLQRRRPRRRLPSLPRLGIRPRAAAIAILCASLVGGGVVLARRPARVDAAQALADAATTLRAGNYSAARRNGERAVAAAPHSAAAHLVLARAWLELGDGLAAEAELSRARDSGVAAARVVPLLAHARLLEGDTAGALEATAGATDPSGLRVRARALAATGDRDQAAALLEALVAHTPDDAAAWRDLGRLRLAGGEIGGAAIAAAQAARLAPGEPAALVLQGEVVRTRYGLVAALPWFEAALARDAYYHPALIEYAATLGEAGRYADALAATRRALLARPGSAQALYLQAVIAARAGKPDVARRLLATTGTALDGLPGALLLAGVLDAETGRTEEAVARWRRLIDAQPMNITARRLLAAALLRSGDPRATLDLLRPMALRGDADGYTLALAARAWEAVGDHARAAALLDRAARGGRDAAALFATDDPLTALVADAIAAPGDPTYVLGVIRGMVSAGDITGAIVRARSLTAARPGDAAAALALGDTLAAAGRWQEAAPAFARAADLQFDEPTALRLIDALGRAGRARDAAAALALYLGQNPQSLSGQRLLGHWQVTAGAWDNAIETLETVRRQTGARDAGVLADLALAYAGAGDGAVARRYGAAAYRLQPMTPAVADAYGVALAADGATDAARQLLDKAIALAPGEATYTAHRRQIG